MLTWQGIKVVRTFTFVSTQSVGAVSIHARDDIFTFIDVSAVTTRLIQLESLVTETFEHSMLILTLAVDTNIVKQLTLINVNTVILVSSVRMHEPHLTLTPEQVILQLNFTITFKFIISAFSLHLNDPG